LWSKHRVSNQTDALFLTTKGKLSPLSERSIDYLIRKYAQAAHISHTVNAQTLRNTYGVHLFKINVPEADILAKLGLTAKESLTRYSTYTPAYAKATAGKQLLKLFQAQYPLCDSAVLL